MSFGKITFGEKVRQVAIQRYKGSEGVVDRISVFAREPFYIKTHFHNAKDKDSKGLGHFYCVDSLCCAMSLPDIRYILPIVQYTQYGPDRYGAPIYVKYLRLSEAQYQQFVVKDQAHGDLTQIDMLVTCTDVAFQKLNFEYIGQAFWRQDQSMIKVIQSIMPDLEFLLQRSVASILSKEMVDKVLSDEGYRRQQTMYTPDNSMHNAQVAAPVIGGISAEQYQQISHVPQSAPQVMQSVQQPYVAPQTQPQMQSLPPAQVMQAPMTQATQAIPPQPQVIQHPQFTQATPPQPQAIQPSQFTQGAPDVIEMDEEEFEDLIGD